MHSKTVDFAPVPPPGELDETYASSLILANSLRYVKHVVIRKTGSTQLTTLPSEEDRATVTDDTYNK